MHMHIEPSLTVDTLTSVLDGVQRVDGRYGIGHYFQIPDYTQDQLECQYDSRQLPRLYSTIFLTQNPSPSWSAVAFALWETGEHRALEVVQKLYLKGQPCIDTHNMYIMGVREDLVAFSYNNIVKQLASYDCAVHGTGIPNVQKGLFMILVDHVHATTSFNFVFMLIQLSSILWVCLISCSSPLLVM